MKTPYNYLVEPVGGRYNNTRKIEGKDIIFNTTQDETDFKYTNRIGKVIATPKREGTLEVGDEVIVHHNTFRKWFNVLGVLKDSANYIKENQFYVGLDQLFAYKRDSEWITLEDYCFIEADKETAAGMMLSMGKEYSETTGSVYLGNGYLEAQGVFKGDKVLFAKTAAYRFDIDGKVLYKMSALRNIQGKI